jgi:hypothetical protein
MASTTTKFSFTRLEGTNQAGYNSINALIDSIDLNLFPIIPSIGSIIIFDTSAGSVPTGWSIVTPSGSGLPTLSGTYNYIKRVS